MKILVTGGGGMLGIALVEELVRYRTETNESFEIRSIDLIPSPVKEHETLRGSILDVTSISEAVRGCDIVVHLAALLGVGNTEKRRTDCLNINILGTLNVLNVCTQEDVQKILFASSSEVYGDCDEIPIREESPLNPISVYAVSKLAGEEYVKAYHERYGLDYVILRFFNTYGVHQVGQFVVSRFIQAILNGEDPVVYGDGKQVRSFCYVSDVAAGIRNAIFSDKADNQTVNMGNPKEPIAICDLAEKVIQISGLKRLKPKFILHEDSDRVKKRDVIERVPSIERAKTLLGFEPKVTLEEGISRIIKYGRITPSWELKE